jgi:hypothetical protein
MLKTIFKDSAVERGFKSDPKRDASLEFSVSETAGIEYMYFRIGRTIAQRAGLRPKDRVALAYDEKTKLGVLKPHPKGWVLQSGDPKSDNPPLVLRVTWRDDWPYLDKVGVCKDVVARDQVLEFYFPEGTTFGKMKEVVPDELYEEHRDIIENGKPAGRKGKKDGHSFRRESDKAPRMKDGKPYGRRHND